MFNLPSGAATSETAPPACQNVRNKTVFNDSSTDDSSSGEEEEEDKDTVDAHNEQYTQDIYNDDDAETEAPQQQTPKEMPKEMPEQSGAPADNAPADDTIVVPLTEEEMVVLTSSDDEPAAEQEENQQPGPMEVFSIGLNEQGDTSFL